MYKQDGLSLQVTGIRVNGPPARAIEFALQLFSNFDDPVVVIGSEVRVTLSNYEIGNGNLLRAHPAPALGAAFGGPNEMFGTILVPFPREVIDWIETRRVGDVEYSLSVSALLAPVLGTDPETLGRPWLQPAQNRYSSSIRDVIPVSEWLKHLRSLGWDETQLFELPAGLPSQSYPPAQARLEEAIAHYRSGSWEETMISCRKVIEALAAVKTEGDQRPDLKKLREFFEPGEKGNALDEVLYSFGQFLHLARHEHPTNAPVKITRSDALLSLAIAGAFLRHLSG